MTKHTPGPWESYPEKSHFTICDRDGTHFAYVVGEFGENGEANARLIAACPTMYDKLEAIRARIQGEFDHPALMELGPLGDLSEDILLLAESAIARAKGESNE